jgi:L-malate glycosyltransferase
MNPFRIALAWENFGPSHRDRIGACVASGLAVTAIEFNAKSQTYLWEEGEAHGAERVTLAGSDERMGPFATFWRLSRALQRSRADAIFLCDYQRLVVFCAALVMRLSGKPVYTMLCSKFDDYPRFWWRELAKLVLLLPYQGAIVGSDRSVAYLLLLGFRGRPMLNGYDSLSVARIQQGAGEGRQVAHAERDFLIVARLVEKKNLAFAIRAYAAWSKVAVHARKLRIIGYGEQEAELRLLSAELGLGDAILFEGVANSAKVFRMMRASLCMILPSTEEQFGLVVIEALASGLPVLASSNAGAVDGLIDNGINGWVIDPYRPAALVAAMTLLDRDADAWQDASAAALASADRGDTRHFAAAVHSLICDHATARSG